MNQFSFERKRGKFYYPQVTLDRRDIPRINQFRMVSDSWNFIVCEVYDNFEYKTYL